ncbi:hypothetical protein D3C78_1138480 [compost metagenome]
MQGLFESTLIARSALIQAGKERRTSVELPGESAAGWMISSTLLSVLAIVSRIVCTTCTSASPAVIRTRISWGGSGDQLVFNSLLYFAVKWIAMRLPRLVVDCSNPLLNADKVFAVRPPGCGGAEMRGKPRTLGARLNRAERAAFLGARAWRCLNAQFQADQDP